jgi:uncharacterized protein DUF4157
MAQRSAGTERSRQPASEPGARRERAPAPTGEVPKLLQLGTALGNRTTTELLAGGLLQRKVAIGPADDPLEREADRVAERVLAQPENAAESISSTGAAVRRKCAACAAGGQPCADCEKEDEELRREAAAGQPAGGPAPAQLDSHLSALGSGQPLSPGLRSYFEPRFGHDFGAVRLHTGTSADAAARAARARAFTLRQDVVFAAGEYTPETRGGRRLLTHELAHVVQQAPPAVRRQALSSETPTPATPTSPTAEAERATKPTAAVSTYVAVPSSRDIENRLKYGTGKHKKPTDLFSKFAAMLRSLDKILQGNATQSWGIIIYGEGDGKDSPATKASKDASIWGSFDYKEFMDWMEFVLEVIPEHSNYREMLENLHEEMGKKEVDEIAEFVFEAVQDLDELKENLRAADEKAGSTEPSETKQPPSQTVKVAPIKPATGTTKQQKVEVGQWVAGPDLSGNTYFMTEYSDGSKRFELGSIFGSKEIKDPGPMDWRRVR